MAFKFEQLKVWQLALDLSGDVNDVVKKFPDNEKYVLNPQIKRAADSVGLNIAEGSTGQTNPEFKRFLGMAIRSAIEVVGCLHLAKKRRIIDEDDFNSLYSHYEDLIKMTQALRNSIK